MLFCRDAPRGQALKSLRETAQAYFPHGMDTHNTGFHDTRLDTYVSYRMSYVRVNKTYQSSESNETYRCRVVILVQLRLA